MAEHTMIPKTMSTQHPDNASVPRWCQGEVLQGEAELDEAFFAYSELGCNEVMWDSEGKDIDTNVVRKLLSKYQEYFTENEIGRDVLLTYRIPNPRIERHEKKLVTETLQSIPLSADVAAAFYKKPVTPVFEVILPFTTSGRELVWLHHYYGKAIADAETLKLDASTHVRDWLGPISPRAIRVIPLVEDSESLLSIDAILMHYMKAVQVRHLRVFIARSDPALNYGLFASVILSKLALSKLGSVERSTGVRLHPIIGVGSLPFRGHLSPKNVEWFLKEYRGLSTVTVQSALRYDYPMDKVKRSIDLLNHELPNGASTEIPRHQEGLLRKSLTKLVRKYQARVEALAPLINHLAAFVPQRRARKLHIGLFGYSRSVGAAALPRAIPFTAAFYSIGIPPEFVGAESLRDLTNVEWDAVKSCYLNINHDLATAGAYVSWETLNMLMENHRVVAKKAGMAKERLRTAIAGLMSDLDAAEQVTSTKLGPKSDTTKMHENFVNNFFISFSNGADDRARVAFLEAALQRKSIG
jgi:phosphoenolpyruvate carboxylase